MTSFTNMSFVEFGNCLQFREMIMGPHSSTTDGLSFKVPGNEIPNWFNHQSVGSSISFWVGPGFTEFALCLVFGTNNGDDHYDCYVDISINGRKQEFTEDWFYRVRYDHLWFCWGKDSISGWHFRDLNLGDRNHVELFCRTTVDCQPTTILPNIIKRIGVHVECICPQISKRTFHQRHRPKLLRGPSFILRRLLLKPRKFISKRNRALATRSRKYLYGPQSCCRCPDYLDSTYSLGSTSGFPRSHLSFPSDGFDLGSS